MANSLITEAISALQAVTSPADTDLIPVGTGGGKALKKLTWANLITAIRKALGIYSGQYVLIGTVYVTPNVPMTKNGAYTGEISTTFTMPSETTMCIPVVRYMGYNTMIACSVSGNVLKTSYMNISGADHSGGGAVTILCFKQI